MINILLNLRVLGTQYSSDTKFTAKVYTALVKYELNKVSVGWFTYVMEVTIGLNGNIFLWYISERTSYISSMLH